MFVGTDYINELLNLCFVRLQQTRLVMCGFFVRARFIIWLAAVCKKDMEISQQQHAKGGCSDSNLCAVVPFIFVSGELSHDDAGCLLKHVD